MLTVFDEKSVSNIKVLQQIYACIIASLTIWMAAYWTVYTSPVSLKFQKEEVHFSLSKTEAEWIDYVLDLGTVLSPIPAGVLMNQWGRKRTLVISAIGYLAASLVAIFANGGEHLFTALLLSGIAKGFSFTVFPLYVAEITSKTVRGALSSVFYASYCAGAMIASGLGAYITFQHLNYIGLSVPVIFLVLVLPLPESPHYYLVRKKYEKAQRSMEWFRDTSTKHRRLLNELELNEARLMVQATEQRGAFKSLLSNRGYKKALLTVVVVTLAQRFGGIGYFLSYAATKDLPRTRLAFGREECFVCFAVVSLVASAIAGLALDRIGRKPMLLFSAIATSAITFVGALYHTFVHETIDPDHNWVPYTVVIGFAFSFTSGLGVVPATLQGELLPPEIKWYASAIVVMAASLASLIVNGAHEHLVRFFGVAGNYWVPAFSTAAFAVWTKFYVFETKGRTLAEIQYSLTAIAGYAFTPWRGQSPPTTATGNPILDGIHYRSSNGHQQTDRPALRKSVSGPTLGKTSNNWQNSKNHLGSSEKFYLCEFKSLSLGDLKKVQQDEMQAEERETKTETNG